VIRRWLGDLPGGSRWLKGSLSALYRRLLTDSARLAITYQWKNAPTQNDDAVNARFHVTFGVEF